MTFLRRSWYLGLILLSLALSACGIGPRVWTRADRTDAFVACHSILGLDQAQCLCVVRRLTKHTTPDTLSESLVAQAVNSCLPPEPEADPFQDHA